MFGWLRKKLGLPSRNEKIIRAMQSKVAEIASFESGLQELSDEQLANKTVEFRDRLNAGVDLDELMTVA